MKNPCIGLLLLLTVLAMALCASSDVDAEQKFDEEYNCNNYNLNFIYTGGTVGEISVVWTAYGITGEGTHVVVRQIGDEPSKDNNWKVRYNPEDVMLCKFIYVTQEITTAIGDKDEITIKVNVIKPPPVGDSYDVMFFDGYSGALLASVSIFGNKHVDVGENFVDMPDAPIREGYSFIGWFVPVGDSGVSMPFDPKQPVESDVSVYAKWILEGDSGDIPDPSKKVISLEVSGKYKTEYIVGDYLDTTGISILATFADESTADVSKKCDFTPTQFKHIGPITVTITYQNVETFFDVIVSDSSTSPDGGNEGGDGGNGSSTVVYASVLNYALIGLVIVVCGIVAYKFLGRGRA